MVDTGRRSTCSAELLNQVGHPASEVGRKLFRIVTAICMAGRTDFPRKFSDRPVNR